MERFRFRFQRVLEVKERREELLRQQLAQRQRQLQAAETALAEAQAKLAAQREVLRSLCRGRVSVEQVSRHAAYIEQLRRQVAECRAELDKAQSAFEASRDRVLAAMTQRKGLQLIKEHDFEAFKRLTARRDQRSLDDIASRQAAKRAEAARGGLKRAPLR